MRIEIGEREIKILELLQKFIPKHPIDKRNGYVALVFQGGYDLKIVCSSVWGRIAAIFSLQELHHWDGRVALVDKNVLESLSQGQAVQITPGYGGFEEMEASEVSFDDKRSPSDDQWIATLEFETSDLPTNFFMPWPIVDLKRSFKLAKVGADSLFTSDSKTKGHLRGTAYIYDRVCCQYYHSDLLIDRKLKLMGSNRVRAALCGDVIPDRLQPSASCLLAPEIVKTLIKVSEMFCQKPLSQDGAQWAVQIRGRNPSIISSFRIGDVEIINYHIPKIYPSFDGLRIMQHSFQTAIKKKDLLASVSSLIPAGSKEEAVPIELNSAIPDMDSAPKITLEGKTLRAFLKAVVGSDLLVTVSEKLNLVEISGSLDPADTSCMMYLATIDSSKMLISKPVQESSSKTPKEREKALRETRDNQRTKLPPEAPYHIQPSPAINPGVQARRVEHEQELSNAQEKYGQRLKQSLTPEPTPEPREIESSGSVEPEADRWASLF